jgi:uroporphyrin-III C-methyltransferase/precorrin-2 dehydrogenase/sirohydrochlorin ferrochelatase
VEGWSVKYLPLFFDLHGQSVLLVGGGGIALRKARLLSRAGATIHAVAPRIDANLLALLDDSGGNSEMRSFVTQDLEGKRLVVAATDDGALNARISGLCQQRNLPVNVVDQPSLCSVIFPAIVDRDPITIAVSSGGGAPILTRSLRAMLESLVPASYGRLASFAARYRDSVKQRVTDPVQRRRFWEQVLHGPIAEMVLASREDRADELFEQALNNPQQATRGEVYLVGGGPGDPDLLTFKAHRLMQQADIVLYDRLVAPTIVDMCRADAERIYVGKRRDQHALPQEEINTLLLRYASQGMRVLRLKGGDPFVFGRGGEEIEQLAEHGIPFQVVPGITAASGCACYAGIPLTHRDYAQSVRFVTGHLQDGSTDLNWHELVNPTETVVFYMGLVGLPVICRSLIAHGRASTTPIALIQQGTTERQRVITGTLDTIVDLVAEREVRAPTLLIVGEVVKLHASLRWFGLDSDSAA